MAYELVQRLMEEIGGTMQYVPGGGPGGVWYLNLRGRVIQVDVRDNSVTPLDSLYVSRVQRPTTWADYDPSAPLVPDAFWKLVALFPPS
jgi:hypothetical protein